MKEYSLPTSCKNAFQAVKVKTKAAIKDKTRKRLFREFVIYFVCMLYMTPYNGIVLHDSGFKI